MMELLRKYKDNEKLNSIAKQSQKYMRELNIEKQED